MSIAKTKTIIFSLLLILSISVFSIVAPAERVSADGEQYRYSDDGTVMIVSGGDLVNDATLTPGVLEGGANTYSGSFTVSWETGIWPFRNTELCKITANVTVNSAGNSGALSVSLEGDTIGNNPTVPSCTEDRALEFFSSATVSIDNTNFNTGAETTEQRQIQVRSYAKNYQSPAASDLITLRQNGTTRSTGTPSLSYNNLYSHTFNGVDAGTYEVCSREAEVCRTVQKVQSVLLRVGLGTPSDFDEEGVVNVEFQFEIVNPKSGGVVDSVTLTLLDSTGVVVDSIITGPRQLGGNVGGTIVDSSATTLYYYESFRDVTPGNYQVCESATNKCESFTKLDSEPAEVVLSTSINQDLSASGDDVDISCAGSSGAFGWIMCPAIEGTLGFINFMSSLIASYLQVPPVEFDSGSPQYQIWQSFRNLALGLMMIAMLVMVFGQALSLNIDAYTVKKMLPRIVIATIGIMLSIYLIAFVVDFFNILGNGVADLVKAPLGGLDVAVGGFPQQATALVGLFAAGAVVFSMGIAAFMLVVLIPVALAFLTVYLTLVIRQVVIIMLIIVAPIAFVLWTIPGTEKYAKTWWSTLFKALMMYPLIMLLLASGQVFAVIITNTSSGGWLATLTALVAIAVPMFLVPATFKMAGGAIGMASGALNNYRANLGKRFQDPNDRLGRNLKQQRAVHDAKKYQDKITRAQGLKFDHSKKGYHPSNLLSRARQAGAAGSLLAMGAGSAIRDKNWFASAGTTKEEMDALGLNNPYAMQDYLKHGRSKESLRGRIAQLEADGHATQANELKRLESRFGTGDTAVAASMLSTLGAMGKLSDESIANTGAFFGGKVSEDGKNVSFGSSQGRAATTFGALATNAGFAASNAKIAQHRYKNMGIMGVNGGKDGYELNRNALEKVTVKEGETANSAQKRQVALMDATGVHFSEDEAADVGTINKINQPSLIADNDVNAWGGTLAKYINSTVREDGTITDPATRQWVSNLASITMGYGSASAETRKAYDDSVISALNGPASRALQIAMTTTQRTRADIGDEGAEIVIERDTGPGAPYSTPGSARPSGSPGTPPAARPRIIKPGDPDYRPPDSSDLPGGTS